MGLSNPGDYNAHFSLTPSLIYHGTGTWLGNWTVCENNMGIEILTISGGSVNFIGNGYLSTIIFKTKLQITRKNVRVIPFPEPEPVLNNWEGNLILVGDRCWEIMS